MRGRLVLALIALALAVTAFGVYGVVIATDGGASPAPAAPPGKPGPAGTFQFEPSETSPSPEASEVPSAPQPTVQVEGPREVAARYLTAWQAGDLTAMAGLVSAPPADFAERHRRFDGELRIAAPPALTQGTLRQRSPLEAEVPFQGTRQVEGLGPWPFSSVLRLVRHAGLWRVRWTPQTMHPSLGEGKGLRLTETTTRRPATLTREGQPFPQDSGAGDYFTGLDGTATELRLREVPSGRVLLSSPTRKGESTRTTISRDAQSAAAHALDGLGAPAA
ncbi:NTF2-like N-terminal transpeptidase domain-containing protein, partial [Streptosporangium saharense]|uniref:NTF2-like N-terminal transpeptidase domain-containing protein n=1 Tax=Streptosporangium saharense TaxID=1706840 RepID=UPI003316E2C3